MRRRLLPRGRPDAIRQILLFGGGYLAYELVRGLCAGDAPRAGLDATRVIDLERSLHVFVEPAIQGWALHRPWLMHAADLIYLNAHGLVSFGVLAYVYLRRPARYARVRDAFLIALALALIGYAVFPTAPPRLMPQWGFVDAVRRFTGVNAERGTARILVNAYAAIPSLHVCFAVLSGGAMARLTRHRAARAAWRLYPLVIVLVVIATGNHYILDVVLGGLTAAAATGLAVRLPSRARPEVWPYGQATA